MQSVMRGYMDLCVRVSDSLLANILSVAIKGKVLLVSIPRHADMICLSQSFISEKLTGIDAGYLLKCTHKMKHITKI